MKNIEDMVKAVQGYVSRCMAPFGARLKAIEDQIETGNLKGEKGDTGESGRDGIDGAPGKDADAATIIKAVAEAVAAIPKAEKGEKGDVGESGRDGIDGAPGKDADSEQIKAAVASAVADLPPAKDGESVNIADVMALVMPELIKAIEGLPKPKDGHPGIDGRDGLEGIPGKDALQIDVCDSIDPLKKYQRGTFATFRGGIVRAYKPTEPLGDGIDLEKAGWHVVVNGVADFSVDVGVDARSMTLRTAYTSGAVVDKTISVPAMIYRGVWTEREHGKGDMVTWGGSLWHCDGATMEKPGEGDNWTLAAKRGRDGKDGKATEAPRDPVRLR